jgi:hypothetical protein
VEDKLLGDEWQLFHNIQSFLSKQKLEKEANQARKKIESLFREKWSENILAGSGIVPILPALRIRFVGSAWEDGRAGLCGFFVARI